MFTGLVADLGRVIELEGDARGSTLTVATRLAAELSEGESVSVNGVCLTATRVASPGGEDALGCFAAHTMGETLSRSSLGALQVGAGVNLELPLRADGRLGGHIVQGHVDGTGIVAELAEEGFSRVLTIAAEPRLLRYVVEKGSIAVDGVSLTVSALGEGTFEVSLIPETLGRTTLGGARAGAVVNLEVDVLAKHVERLLKAQ